MTQDEQCALVLCLLWRCVMRHQPASVHKRYVIFVSIQMHPLLSFVTSFSFFFSSRRRLEAVRAITTWGREWHLESDGWKGIKFSLEPTVWNWYSTPLYFSPPYFSPHKQATALTYSNRRSSLSLVVRPVLKKRSGKREWRKKEPRGRKLSNCTFELMPFNLSLSHWVIKKNKK